MAVKNVKWTIEKNKQNLWIHANNMSVCLMCLVGEPQSISHLIAQAVPPGPLHVRDLLQFKSQGSPQQSRTRGDGAKRVQNIGAKM